MYFCSERVGLKMLNVMSNYILDALFKLLNSILKIYNMFLCVGLNSCFRNFEKKVVINIVLCVVIIYIDNEIRKAS